VTDVVRDEFGISHNWGQGRHVTSAALLATYGRQNEIDTILQASWDLLAAGGAELDPT
jgi:hypothetical protein